MKTTNTPASKTIVFITGAFVSHTGWAPWQEFFEKAGYTTYAPAWPGKNNAPDYLRNNQPIQQLARLTFPELVEHYAAFIRQLPEKPIVIGHSMGGLLTQLMVQKDLVAGGIAIHSAPPQGVLSFAWPFIKSITPTFGFFTSLKKNYMMSFKHWQYAFTNGMPLEAQRKAYEENTLPESKRALRGALTAASRINFSKAHAPLLFVSGGKDQILPASLQRKNFRKYKQNGSVTEFKEFPENNHFVVGLSNWKMTAGFIQNWITEKHI